MQLGLTRYQEANYKNDSSPKTLLNEDQKQNEWNAFNIELDLLGFCIGFIRCCKSADGKFIENSDQNISRAENCLQKEYNISKSTFDIIKSKVPMNLFI